MSLPAAALTVPPGPAVARRTTTRALYALALLTLINAFNNADRALFGLLLPLIKAEMHISDTMLGLMSGFAFAIFYALAGVPIALLADRRNRRNIIAIGFALWSLMTALTGLAQNVWHMLAARFLLGAGEAAGPGPSNSLISDLVSERRRPLALAIVASGASLSFMIAFPLMGWVAQHHGWRNAFLVAGAPGMLVALIFFLTVREPARARPAGSGAVPSIRDSLRLLAASRTYAMLLLSLSVHAVSTFGFLAWTPAFLARAHGLSPQALGGYMGVIVGPTGVVGGLVGGALATALVKRDRRWLAWAPAIMIALLVPSQFLFLYGPGDLSWQAGAALQNALVAAQAAPLYALGLGAAGPHQRATATAGMLVCMYLFGQTLGPLIVGGASDVFAPALGPASLRLGLTLLIAFTFAGALICWRIARHLDPAPSSDSLPGDPA